MTYSKPTTKRDRGTTSSQPQPFIQLLNEPKRTIRIASRLLEIEEAEKGKETEEAEEEKEAEEANLQEELKNQNICLIEL